MSQTSPFEIFVSCPFCDETDLMMCEEDSGSWVMCTNCLSCGPIGKTGEEASFFWMSRQFAEEGIIYPSGSGSKRLVSSN